MKKMSGLGLMFVIACCSITNAEMLVNFNCIAFNRGWVLSGHCGVLDSAGDYWNQGEYSATSPSPMALKDCLGNSTPLTLASTFTFGYYSDDYYTMSNPYTILDAFYQTSTSATVTISGFSGTSAAYKYDLYIYDAYLFTSVHNSVYTINGGASQTCYSGHPINYTSFVEGQNYVVFHDVSPVNGQIVITVRGPANDVGTFCALQLQKTAYVPPVTAAPEFDPGASDRMISGPTPVTMTCSTPNAVIYYTLDGTTPTINSTPYQNNSPVTVDPGTTVKAMAVADGYSESAVTVLTYGQVVNFNCVAYNRGWVSDQNGVVGGAGDYWNQEDYPQATSILALKDCMGTSTPLTLTSTFTSGYYADFLPTSNFVNPCAILYSWFQTAQNGSNTVTISGFSGVAAASKYDLYIYDTWPFTPASSHKGIYSVNGGASQTCNSGDPINSTSFVEGQNYVVFRDVSPVNGQMVITVTAAAGDWGTFCALQLQKTAYVPPVTAAPEFDPGASDRVISGPTPVTMTCSTPNAVIYYTLDGTTPTTNSTPYQNNSPVTVNPGTTVRAMAVADGYAPSAVTVLTYAQLVNFNCVAFNRGWVSGQNGMVGGAGDYWNQGEYSATSPSPMALKDCLGNSTPLTLASTFTFGYYSDDYYTMSNPCAILDAFYETSTSATVTISGFSGTSAAYKYDLYIYDAYLFTSVHNSVYTINGGASQTCYSGHPINYTSFVEGQNYVVFHDVSPVNGQIVITVNAGNGSNSGTFSALQLVANSYIPPAYNRPQMISHGSANVDGVLSDWAGAEWTPLDQVYDGSPTDIAEAYYAAKWTADKVYVAVKVRDTARKFTNTYTSSEANDHVEFFIHTTGPGPLDYSGTQADAQQYSVGITNSDRTAVWSVLGNNQPIPAEAGFQAAGMESADWLYYEVAITPFQFLSLWGTDENVPSPLAVGQVIGLDVCVASNSGSGYTGMKSENTMRGKYHDYSAFGLHKLITLPGDANYDYRVTFEDFSTLQNHYGQSVTGDTWGQGDFNGDGQVTFGDFSILQNHYGQSGGSAGPAPAATDALATLPCSAAALVLLTMIGWGLVHLKD